MINPPMSVPPIMLSGLDLIIIQARLHVNGKTARKITEVAEVAGMEGDKPRLNAIWKYNCHRPNRRNRHSFETARKHLQRRWHHARCVRATRVSATSHH